MRTMEELETPNIIFSLLNITMMKLGSKRLAGAAKFGQKSLHAGAKFGQKLVGPAAAIAAAAAPELAIPIAVGAEVAPPILKGLQRASR